MAGPHFESLGAAVVALVLCFALTFAAAAVGAAASINAGQFYQTLRKPAWAPSPSVFGPVWTVLYTLIALAAFLVIRQLGWRSALVPMLLFVVQLALNAVWTWLFFRWHLGVWAFADIVVLLAVLVPTAWAFWRALPLAGALFVPYIAWVSFATALTWSVWRMNPGVL